MAVNFHGSFKLHYAEVEDSQNEPDDDDDDVVTRDTTESLGDTVVFAGDKEDEGSVITYYKRYKNEPSLERSPVATADDEIDPSSKLCDMSGKEELSYTSLPPKLKERAKIALLKVADSFEKEEPQKSSKCSNCLKYCFLPNKRSCHCHKTCCYHSLLEVEPMTPSLERGSRHGKKIAKQIMLPILPKVFRDVWVAVEIGLAVFQLIFSLINIQFNTNRTYNILYIIFSVISTILACTDVFIYYYQLQSCRVCCKKMCQHGRVVSQSTLGTNQNKYINFMATWLEMIRTILSELLVYPLMVLDLFELFGGSSFKLNTQTEIISFVLFLFSCFYFVLSVYVVRIIMLALTVSTLNQLGSLSATGSKYNKIFVRFYIHMIGQFFIHFLCIVAVGVKIKQENTLEQESYQISPFLWVVVLSGWIIPLMGTLGFFVVNYYWLESFSIHLFIEMMSLLESKNFAEAVFHGKDKILSNAYKKSTNILKKIELNELNKKNKERNKACLLAKLLYPLKIPVFHPFALLYTTTVVAFSASLLLTTGNDGSIEATLTNNDAKSIIHLLLVVLLLMGNIQLNFVIVLISILFACILPLLPPIAVLIPFLYCALVIRKRTNN